MKVQWDSNQPLRGIRNHRLAAPQSLQLTVASLCAACRRDPGASPARTLDQPSAASRRYRASFSARPVASPHPVTMRSESASLTA